MPKLIARGAVGILQTIQRRFEKDPVIGTVVLVVPDRDMPDNQMSIESLGNLDPRFLANPMNLHS